jgi:hypothetical protein
VTAVELQALLSELTAHMVSKGVRRVKLASEQGWNLEIELDPAAQFLNADSTERIEPKPKPPGECRSPGCEKKGGHMGQPWCPGHFAAQLRGQG